MPIISIIQETMNPMPRPATEKIMKIHKKYTRMSANI